MGARSTRGTSVLDTGNSLVRALARKWKQPAGPAGSLESAGLLTLGDGEPWEGFKGGSDLRGLCTVAGAEDRHGLCWGRLGPEEVTSACVLERQEAL